MSTTWRWTDNPGDPCAYCVIHWTRHGNPVDIRGRRQPRVFNGIHLECAAAVAAYQADADDFQ